MTLKKDIELVVAVANAGFKLVGSKSIGTDDGACWEATLARGSQKLVTVSNGGYGGPDEVRPLQTAKNSIASIKAALADFVSIPQVRQIILDYRISIEAITLDMDRCTNEELEAKKAEILVGAVKADEESLGVIVGKLGDIKQTIAMLKRNLKTRILFVTAADEAKGQFSFVKGADTAANRETLKRRHPDIDYFVADVLGTLA